MACEVNNKEINSQCAELLVGPTYIYQTLMVLQCTESVASSPVQVICNVTTLILISLQPLHEMAMAVTHTIYCLSF